MYFRFSMALSLYFGVALSLFVGCATTAADIPGKPPGWLVEEFQANVDPGLRLEIVREAAARGDITLIPFLCSAAVDRDSRVRQTSVEGLVSYGGSLDDSQRDQTYLSVLNDRLHVIRDMSLRGIRDRFRDDRRPQTLMARLEEIVGESEDYRLRLAALRILSTVEGESVDSLLMDRAQNDEHSQVRKASVRALGHRKVAASRKLLNRLRNKDMDSGVRAASEEALSAIGGVISEAVLVVMPFDTRSRQKTVRSFTAGLQDFLSGALARANLATVVERRQIDRAMDELIFQDDHIDDGKAVEVGKFLRANHVLTGTVQLNGDQLTVVAKRIDVVSGAIVQSIQVHGRSHDADALQQDAAHELVRTFQ